VTYGRGGEREGDGGGGAARFGGRLCRADRYGERWMLAAELSGDCLACIKSLQ